MSTIGISKKSLQLLAEVEQMEGRNSSKASEAKTTTTNKLHEIDVSKIPSPVLARLIDEVRNEERQTASAYNRYHNRHNRSR